MEPKDDELLEHEYINLGTGRRLVFEFPFGWCCYDYPNGALVNNLSFSQVERLLEDNRYLPYVEDKYECSLVQREILTGSFPTEAAKVFLYRLQTQLGWTIRVKNTRTNDVYYVNGATGEIELYE